MAKEIRHDLMFVHQVHLRDMTAAAMETPAMELKLGTWERRSWMAANIMMK